MKNKTVCFITKNYPPAIGGMENYCRDLVKYLRNSNTTVNLVANSKGKKWLPLFAFKAFFQGLRYALKSDLIWIGDGSISFFGWFFSKITGKPWYVTVHALDITWNKPLYQKLIPWFLKQATYIVAVSSYTKQECIARGILAEKILVIPNAIDSDLMIEVLSTKESLMKKFRIPLQKFQGKKLLFSIGRHIERKGIHWFLREVLPILGDDVFYVIAGSGPYTQKYEKIIASKGLENVCLVGRISDTEKFAFYNYSDRFVMPNILVEGDAEGFGIVCIEAGWYGCPVITTGIEGIEDAVVNGKSGFVVPQNGEQWKACLKNKVLDKEHTLSFVRKKFNWLYVIEEYNAIVD